MLEWSSIDEDDGILDECILNNVDDPGLPSDAFRPSGKFPWSIRMLGTSCFHILLERHELASVQAAVKESKVNKVSTRSIDVDHRWMFGKLSGKVQSSANNWLTCMKHWSLLWAACMIKTSNGTNLGVGWGSSQLKLPLLSMNLLPSSSLVPLMKRVLRDTHLLEVMSSDVQGKRNTHV